jgi:zinc transport system permease protein
LLEYAFMQRAFAAAVIVGAVCGVLGFFVVLRRLAFIGVGISHSALGGVALGLLLGVSPLLTGGAFALLVALGIALAGQRSGLGRDTVIGVFFSGAMALGVVLASLGHGAQQELFGYLFGNVLAVTRGELALLGGGGALVVAALLVLLRPQLFLAFDEEIARAYGQRVQLLDVALLALLAATIVIGVRLVGVLLIEALLVVPAATSALLARDYRRQLALSVALAVASALGGLALAWQLDVAPGGMIALAAVALFFVAFAARGLRA